MQVSLYVSHHKRRTVQCSASSKSRPSEIFARFGRKISKQPSLLAFDFVHEGVNGSEARGWLALRAGVLRRAVSQSGTAQERRAGINAITVSLGNRGASPKTKSWVSASFRSPNSPKSTSGIFPNPQENHLLFAGLARPMVQAFHAGSFTHSSAG